MLSEEERKILKQAEEILKREEENVYQDAGSVYSNPRPAYRENPFPEERTQSPVDFEEPRTEREDHTYRASQNHREARNYREERNYREGRGYREERNYRDVNDYSQDRTGYNAPEPERPRRETERPGRETERPGRAPERPVKEPEAPRKEKPKKKKGPVLFLLFVILLLLGAGLFAAVYVFVGKTNYQPYEDIAEEAGYNLPAENDKRVKNILLIGTDARDPNVESRSDSIIVVSICPKQRKIYLTSILRDSYVDIPGYGRNRINHAFQMGGPRLLVQTIEQNFAIRIDNYAKVDFYSFIDIIDAIGGVDIEVTGEEVHYVDAYLSEINQLMGIEAQDSFIYEAGKYTFNGRQALAFSRIRYIGTDFGRTARQRVVLEAAVQKIKSSGPKALINAGGTVLEKLTTDITDLDMTLLVFRSIILRNYEIVSNRIPYDGTWWNDLTPEGQEVLGMDFEQIRQQFRNTIYADR